MVTVNQETYQKLMINNLNFYVMLIVQLMIKNLLYR